jgi:hypothetical protein
MNIIKLGDIIRTENDGTIWGQAAGMAAMHLYNNDPWIHPVEIQQVIYRLNALLDEDHKLIKDNKNEYSLSPKSR